MAAKLMLQCSAKEKESTTQRVLLLAPRRCVSACCPRRRSGFARRSDESAKYRHIGSQERRGVKGPQRQYSERLRRLRKDFRIAWIQRTVACAVLSASGR